LWRVASQKRQSENGELVTAAVREAREEGLDIRLDHLLNVYSYTGRAPVIIVYVATMTGGTLAVDDPDDVRLVRFGSASYTFGPRLTRAAIR
jgi:ADP-ribose pyrophosphatase YjhB (NUDIX family)